MDPDPNSRPPPPGLTTRHTTPTDSPDSTRNSAVELEIDRYGPLRLARYRKPDGRALLLFSMVLRARTRAGARARAAPSKTNTPTPESPESPA